MPDCAGGSGVLVRDLVIFQIKLLLDGLKDVVLSQLGIGAALLDLVFPTERRGSRFYAIMRIGERFDRWLNLYGAAEHADRNEDGLFGESLAGADSLLGRLEEIVTGRKETADDKSAAA